MTRSPRGGRTPGGIVSGREDSSHRRHVLVSTDCDAAARAASEIWVVALRGGTREAPRRVLLAGGSTPERLYRLLADDRVVPRSLWRGIECFFGDERCVPPDHPDSNFGMVRRSLLAPLGDSAPDVHRIHAEDPSSESAAAAYETLIRSRFAMGRDEVPSFDLALLGVGPDGHTASLFPGAEPRPDSPRLVSPALRPEDGSRRITVTYRVLDASRRVLFFVCGEEKSDAVARCLAFGSSSGSVSGQPKGGTSTPASAAPPPAALVRPVSGEVFWILDEAAAQGAVPEQRA